MGTPSSLRGWREKCADTGLPVSLLQVGDGAINHVIIIKYSHGVTHYIPWHSDKQQGIKSAGTHDIQAGTTIYSLLRNARHTRLRNA